MANSRIIVRTRELPAGLQLIPAGRRSQATEMGHMSGPLQDPEGERRDTYGERTGITEAEVDQGTYDSGDSIVRAR